MSHDKQYAWIELKLDINNELIDIKVNFPNTSIVKPIKPQTDKNSSSNIKPTNIQAKNTVSLAKQTSVTNVNTNSIQNKVVCIKILKNSSYTLFNKSSAESHS